jgi:hypothetical protein
MARVALAVVVLSLAATAAAAEERNPPGSPSAAPAQVVDPLALRLEALLSDDPKDTLAVNSAPRERGGGTPCPVDWCQPRVDVPGIGASRGGVSRPELVARILDDADVAPLASLVWLFAQTGLEVQWTPPHMDTSASSSGGKGNFFVWLKLRIDAWNRPSFPVRERDRIRREQEEAQKEQARAAEEAQAHRAEEARAAAQARARAAEEARQREAEQEQAREAERARELAAQRPARLSST